MITESKLKTGTLTLDALPFASQATNVSLVPSVDEQGDPIETLSGDQKGADEVTTWVLKIEAVQDFDDPTGFVKFCFDNAGQAVPFSWEASATSPTWSGSLTVRAVEFGGPVNTRNTTEAEFPVIGTPTWTPAV
jgi:hypothetical protein